MRKWIFLGLIGGLTTLQAQNFEVNFENKTIRLDYYFSGNAKQQLISFDRFCRSDGWAGRRVNLNRLPVEGNGQIYVTDKVSGDTLYATSFSSLFQEWVCEEEAKKVTKAFENSFLIPQPKRPAVIHVQLRNNRKEVVAKLEHDLDPTDILIEDMRNKPVLTYRYLLQSGSPETCIDLAIMAEGYAKKDEATFWKDAQTAVDALFGYEPFQSMKKRFNVVGVWTPSADSGVSIPRKNDWRETAVGSHFDTFYSDRYLTTTNVQQIHNLLNGIPYEHILILANTDTYGGGGIYNSYLLTTTHHPSFRPVVVHEFGHSFAGLADEYAYSEEPSSQYPYDIEPWENNITTLVDFSAKWKDMIKPGIPVPTPPMKNVQDMYTKVGVYEGGGYTLKKIYRPTTDCRMKTNEAPVFCPVCQRALRNMIDFYTKQQ